MPSPITPVASASIAQITGSQCGSIPALCADGKGAGAAYRPARFTAPSRRDADL
ncbi:hypothetical protein AruPA_19630 [Acidiphilium sp. PA]|uniref:hypothetical protein n=1 Tax=Acidiphilium sp. PA TaxID=2871705 RepID=UPI002243ABAD|nr:hypothetical protein [Acidiphilium sp. PA]MCW8309248.1 hypothetical protein [Acidiphilium sp. PA]